MLDPLQFFLTCASIEPTRTLLSQLRHLVITVLIITICSEGLCSREPLQSLHENSVTLDTQSWQTICASQSHENKTLYTDSLQKQHLKRIVGDCVADDDDDDEERMGATTPCGFLMSVGEQPGNISLKHFSQ